MSNNTKKSRNISKTPAPDCGGEKKKERKK
jgi:hypothetical protein